MTQQDTYNGWSNFETWQANEWLYDSGAIDCLREDGTLNVEFLTDELEHRTRLIVTPQGLLRDIITRWLQSVNVREIVEKNRD